MKSAFPQDMLLWPDGQPRVLNSDNHLQGEINGVAYRVAVKGDFAICSLVNTKTGLQHRMVQPHFNAIGLMLACAEVAQGQPGHYQGEYIGLRRGPDDSNRLDGY